MIKILPFMFVLFFSPLFEVIKSLTSKDAGSRMWWIRNGSGPRHLVYSTWDFAFHLLVGSGNSYVLSRPPNVFIFVKQKF